MTSDPARDRAKDLAALRQAQLKAAQRDAEAAGHKAGSPEWEQAVDRAMARLREYEGAAVELRKLWDAAKPAGTHPYLERKGVTSAPGLKQDGDKLLVPMKGLERGNPLMNIQTIWPDGKKLFGKGGRAGRTRTTIGADGFKKNGTLYVCEGWVTGWTIWHVTGDAVVVAFSAGNLEHVAVAMREKYPLATIIVAADNDRWSGAANPGVTQAREAAIAARAQVAIPDFPDLATRPTDFNDLYLLQGREAVLEWLDPAKADQAVTSVVAPPPPPPPPDIEPTPDDLADDDGGEPPPPVPPAAQTWQDRAPFRCLGYDRGTYYYLPRGTGQITDLTSAQHDRKWLLPLAPASWWEQEFPHKQGADWHSAADALFRESHRAGVFKPERLRGRGCWPEEDAEGKRTILLHLGDRLLPGGARGFVDPERYEGTGRLIYERLPRLSGPSTTRALALDETRELLALFDDLLWYDDASGALLAGWTVLAPVCGALPWRPHVWVTGGAGAGKSVILSKLVRPLLGGTERYYEGGTTEAGIRQELRADALPVLYDEAEKQDARSDGRIQSVLALARSASSMDGAHTAKGTTHGSAMSFQVRSMFCLASIGGSVRQEADKTRISLLQLKSRGAMEAEARREHWEGYRPRLDRVKRDTGRELIARTLGWLRDGRLAATVEIMRTQASIVLGDQRSGDQYGTLLAGTWTLMADEPPGAEEAREVIASHGLSGYISEQAPEGLRVIRSILQADVRVDTSNGAKTMAVGEMVDACMAGTAVSDDADRWLRSHGIRVELRNGEYVLELANTSEWISSILRDTPYSDGWHTQLRTLPGVTTGPPRRFHAGLTSRITVVPRGAYD